MTRHALSALVLATILTGGGCAGEGSGRGGPLVLAEGVSPEGMERMTARFSPAGIDFDDRGLEPWEKQVLLRLVEVSDLMHEIFTIQVSGRNPEYRRRLEAMQGPGREAALAYFDLMAGPWDRLDGDRPFLAVGPKPAGAGFYPATLTSEELHRWLRSHPEDRQNFTSFFSVIHRDKGILIARPYSTEYERPLRQAAALLREAATHSRNASLTTYLELRALALLSNDYLQSDLAWLDLDSRIEPAIGPYELFEDRLTGYKASFGSVVAVVDTAATAALQRLQGEIPSLEAALPVEERYRNLDRGFESPIRVVDVVHTAGDARAGAQTIAFTRPNDERVRQQRGTKKVLLQNVMRARFENVLTAVAAEVLAPGLADGLEFQPWFATVLMHEVARGLGPVRTTPPSGVRTPVKVALREHHTAIEEIKADAAGLHSLTVLAGRGLYNAEFVRRAFVGHLAALFRGARLGPGEAHGRSALVQLGHFLEAGAIAYDPAIGRFTVDHPRLVDANRELAGMVLTIQAEGSFEEAGALLDRYTGMRPEIGDAVARLERLPFDVRPLFTARERMSGW